MSRTGATFVVAMSLAALTACSDDSGTGPEPIAGLYQLRDVGGQTLPATIFEDMLTSPSGNFFLRILVTEASLDLTAGGRYEQRVKRSVFIDDQPAPSPTRTDRGIYSVSGDTIRFTSDLIQGVSFKGTLTAAGISVEQDLSEENRPLSYRYSR